MKLKLKENPREWQKFAGVLCILFGAAAYGAFRRKWIPSSGLIVVGVFIAIVLLSAILFPRPFRGVYRIGMTLSFHIGQFMGRILLSVLFLVCVTPLGWLLRVLGKDVLQLKATKEKNTYWQPVRSSSGLDRMF